jgi:succinyl-CoA synthetase beta subunit
MKLYEHEAKGILKEMGLSVPSGRICKDLSDLESIMEEIGIPAMLKGQVLVGGRGKAGAVRQVLSSTEAKVAFETIMGMYVNGHKVESVLYETSVDHLEEWYLAITIDYAQGLPSMLFCRYGGVDIESVPQDELVRITIDPLEQFPEDDIRQALLGVGVEHDHLDGLLGTVRIIWAGFREKDCELIEINPLMLLEGGGLVAADAKMILNDDGLFRHPEFDFDPDRERTLFERRCRKSGLSGIELEGEVGVLANGAGLTMAILDKLTEFGLKGGAFLDLGGSDDPEKVKEAVTLITDASSLPHLKGAIICVFGGITKCDTVALGILRSFREGRPNLPIAIRLRGMNEEQANTMLRENGLRSYSDLNSVCISLANDLERS